MKNFEHHFTVQHMQNQTTLQEMAELQKAQI